MTSFIGREHETAEVERLLGSVSLLTLTGMGGSGKTRLALRVASGLAERYPGGVWLAELAALSDPEIVPQAVAGAIGVRDESRSDLAALIAEHLSGAETLLVLDNCEHVVEACASFVDALLRACPGLRILATSRQALGLNYEATWPVPALSLPDPRKLPSIEEMARYEAVQLFVERARLKCPDFELAPESAAPVAQICSKLDGIPLALELAAARVRVLSVEQIAERLDESLRLLSAQGHASTPRHKTLVALMDWSYDLLTEAERALLRSLSVFAGQFTLEAVHAVLGGEVDQYEVIDLLSQLADKSLVIVQGREGQARYRLLETIRQYAREKLVAAGEEEAARTHHRDWYLQLAEESEALLVTEQQLAWLERLEEEHDNLRAALSWSLSSAEFGVPELGFAQEPGEWDEGRRTKDEYSEGSNHTPHSALRTPHLEAGLRLAGALAWFWYFRGYLREGRTWLESMLASVEDDNSAGSWAVPNSGTPHSALAKALSAAGILAFLQSDYAAARAHLEKGLQLWRGLGDKRSIAFTGTFLGRAITRQGDPAGRVLSEESAALFREIGEKWGLALSLDFLGQVLSDWGEEQAASALHEESLALYQEMGHKWGVGLELSHSGRVALRQGDHIEARARLEEALALQEEVGDKRGIAWTLHPLGDLARDGGDYGRAVSLYSESLGMFRELGDKEGTASSLALLAEVSRLQGDPDRATELRAESQALFDELDASDLDKESGKRTQESDDNIPQVLGQSPIQALHTPHSDDLTRREIEVLQLIAEGLTAAQVAERLFLSTRTVQAHVRSIYTKLGITSRSAVTRYAVEHGLV